MRAGGLLLAGALLLAVPAGAQVTTNSSALDALSAPSKPAPRRPVHRPAPHKPASISAPAPEATPPKPASPAPAAALPTVPATPPAILALPPPIAVPLAHPPPPPVVPLTADAPGAPSPIEAGVRVTFGAERADLNQASVDALQAFARNQLHQPRTSITISAYASGRPEDPSTPRRLSLERALAARAVLMEAGIPSPRIYPRALGPTGGGDVPDRVDVVAGPTTHPAAQGVPAQGAPDPRAPDHAG